MKHQIRAQRDAPDRAVRLTDRGFGHLRLWPILAVEAEQRVEHQEAMVARLVGGGPNRIQHGEVRLRHELQHLRCLATRDGGQSEGGSGGEEGAAAHGSLRATAKGSMIHYMRDEDWP